MITAQAIIRYRGKSVPQLIKIAERHFNAHIRRRDAGKTCISCPSAFTQAGHFYSAGHYSSMRFDENNVHGQCVRCNTHLHGNLNEYRLGLIKRYGLPLIEELDFKAIQYKRNGWKWDRYYLIEIIEKYKNIN